MKLISLDNLNRFWQKVKAYIDGLLQPIEDSEVEAIPDYVPTEQAVDLAVRINALENAWSSANLVKTSYMANGKIIFTKIGRIVIVTLNGVNESVGAGKNLELGTVSEEWFPAIYTYSEINKGVRVAIGTTGVIAVTNSGTDTVTNLIGQMVYLTNA